MDEFYAEQLRSALGDILAIAKPRWVWRGKVWDERVARAKRLLKRHAPIRCAPSALPVGDDRGQ